MLDGNGVKAMPGSIPAPNPGSFNNLKEKNMGSQQLAYDCLIIHLKR